MPRWRFPFALSLGLALACTETPTTPEYTNSSPELLATPTEEVSGTYTDRAALLAAAPDLAYTTIDFATFDDGSPITGQQFLSTLLLRGATFHNVYSYYGLYMSWSGITRVDLPPNTYAIGIDLLTSQGPVAPPGTWTMVLSTSLGTAAIASYGTPFLGMVSPTPLQWIEYGYDTDVPLMDNLVYGVGVPDLDVDGVGDATDNCPEVANADQADSDGDAQGDACDLDDDEDGVNDADDNCPTVNNAAQADNDSDSIGDPCDPDDDNDSVIDATDNCILAANSGQSDADTDGIGDLCDPDDDNDGVNDGADNCRLVANSNQADVDGDGTGDVCDPTPNPSLLYNFTGFFQPVDNGSVLNQAKAGSSIPVKFKLGGNQGLDVLAAISPTTGVISCSSVTVVDQVESTTTNTPGLTYDPAADQYIYVWKTQSAWKGTCRQFMLNLKDGTQHIALFQFK